MLLHNFKCNQNGNVLSILSDDETILEIDREKKTFQFPKLGELREGKLIPCNFGKIKHLKGSRMVDSEEKMMDLEAQKKFTDCKRYPMDFVLVTEKIDGMNAGLLFENGNVFPINRKGYDVRSKLVLDDGNLNILFLSLALWVSWAKRKNYIQQLPNGFRQVFENTMMIHSLEYEFRSSPCYLLAMYDDKGKRILPNEVVNVGNASPIFSVPSTLCMGIAVEPEKIVRQFGKGVAGCKENMEGIVYSYLSCRKGGKMTFESSAKYVSNTKAGTHEKLPSKFNKFPGWQEWVDLMGIVKAFWRNEEIFHEDGCLVEFGKE